MRMKNRQYQAPSGLRNCWMLWRHCCCRYGLYPLAVAPVLTAGFFLSLYSSAGCHYIDLEVGFTPSNDSWNQSSLELGLFFYYDENAEDDKRYKELLHGGCRPYSDKFVEAYIEKDRTWTVARVMAAISASASGFSALLVWLIALAPMPANCLWPGILLPMVMTGFIAEGSKFLIFDIALCRNELWFPSGVDSLPTSAESCSLGDSALAAIASGSVLLLALLMVCLKAPDKRDLDPDFGLDYTTGAEHDMDVEETDPDEHFHQDVYDVASPEHPTIGDEDVYISHMAEDSAPEERESGSRDTSTLESGDDSPVKPSVAKTSIEPYSGEGGKEGIETTMERVSESRLTAMSRLEMVSKSESEDLIEKLVSDLDSSFEGKTSVR